MSKAQMSVAGTITAILLVMAFSPSSSFAENPTPYNEWDFDFTDVQITQNQNNLNQMEMSIEVLFKGEKSHGTVNILVEVTEPDGTKSNHFGQLNNIIEDHQRTLHIRHYMNQEGTYQIHTIMTPPEEEHIGHVFDEYSTEFTVGQYGFERQIDVIGIETDNAVRYQIESPNTIAESELLHSVVEMPEHHMFEKISVTNDGNTIMEFPIGTIDIYLDSRVGYSDVSIDLVKQQTLIPKADANEMYHDYVSFFSVSDSVCRNLDCVLIEKEQIVEPEISMHILVFIFLLIGATAIVIGVMIMKKKKKVPIDSEWGKPIEI